MEAPIIATLLAAAFMLGYIVGGLRRVWLLFTRGLHDGDLANIYNAAHDEMRRRGHL